METFFVLSSESLQSIVNDKMFLRSVRLDE